MTVGRMVKTRTARRPVVRLEARFAARAEGLSDLHAAFDDFFDRAEAEGVPVGHQDQLTLRTAGGEIAANIVEHACLHLPDPEMRMVLARHVDRVEVTFEDPGTPYVGPVPREPETIPLGGRGMMLVEASVDTVEYVRTGTTNRWRLVRTIPPPPGDG